MLSQWIRLFYYNGTTLSDKSLDSSLETGFLCPFISGHFLYIAQSFPFNNFSVEMNDFNLNSGKIKIEYWSNNSWREAVDVLDASYALTKNGTIQFNIDDDFSWSRVNDSKDENGFVPLDSIRLYDSYFVRISLNSAASILASIKKISYEFCTDKALRSIDPEINAYLPAWGGVTKLNWKEQIRLGSETVIFNLKARALIKHSGQIMRLDDVFLATAYATLMHIYAPFGKGFEDKKQNAADNFLRFLDSKSMTIDQNKTASIEPFELNQNIGRGVR